MRLKVRTSIILACIITVILIINLVLIGVIRKRIRK